MNGNIKRIQDVIRRIPRGAVASYGQVARLAGLPRNARQVGAALGALEEKSRLPWHRVVNAAGRLSAREHPNSRERQRARLESEGIEFGAGGSIPLERFGWKAGRRR